MINEHLYYVSNGFCIVVRIRNDYHRQYNCAQCTGIGYRYTFVCDHCCVDLVHWMGLARQTIGSSEHGYVEWVHL